MDEPVSPSTSTQDLLSKTNYSYSPRRMRQSKTNVDEDSSDVNTLQLGTLYQHSELSDKYIAKVVKTFGRRSSAAPYHNRKENDPTSFRAIHERLTQIDINCDLIEMACGVEMCGRIFETLPVLAYHLSYAHQDLSKKNNDLSTCLVCGQQLRSAKGRNAHLMSKHRNLAAEHNSQCLEQRDTIISPLAPAAQRLHIMGNQICDGHERFIAYGVEDELSSPTLLRSSDHLTLHE